MDTAPKAEAHVHGAKWKPYAGSQSECPFALLLPRALDPALECWWALRWQVLWPMHWRVLGTPWTLGECIFLPLVVGVVVYSCVVQRSSPEGSGGVASYVSVLPFLFAARNSVLTLLVGLPFERALWYHINFGYLTLILGIFHGVVCLYWVEEGDAMNHRPFDTWSLDMITGDSDMVTGFMLVCCFFFVCAVAFWPVRRRLYQVFQRLHIFFALACLVLAVIHESTITAVGLAVWLVDTLIFAALAFLGSHKARSAEAVIRTMAGELMEISFPRGGFRYKGGQYVFICVPGVGWEWHPFTISSAPHQETVTLHIKKLGDWTKNLQKLADKPAKHPTSAGGPLKVFVDGPYGAPSVDLEGRSYEVVLLVCGGIGVTPMLSIWSELLEQHTRGRPLQHLQLVWSVADRNILSILGDGSDEISPVAAGDIYLTREKPAEEGASPVTAQLSGCPEPTIHVGSRPDYDKILSELVEKTASVRQKRAAVLVCGPAGMVKQLRRCCVRASTLKVSLDFHSETFEF